MKSPSEETVWEGVRNHPHLEPRAEFVANLENKLVAEARKLDRKKGILRNAPWIGGAAAAVIVAAVVLSPDAQQSLRSAFVQEQAKDLQSEPNQEQNFEQILAELDVNAERLPTGERIMVRDGFDPKGKPVLITDDKTIFLIKDEQKQPLLTAQEAFGVQEFSEDAHGALIDSDDVYFYVKAKDHGTLLCFLNPLTGELRKLPFEPEYGVTIHNTMHPTDDLSTYKVIVSWTDKTSQNIIAIDKNTLLATPVVRSERDYLNWYTVDVKTQSLLMASAYRILQWKDGQISTIAQSEQPEFSVSTIQEGVLYYSQGPGAIEQQDSNNSYYRGTTRIHKYDLETGQDLGTLLPDVEGHQQLILSPLPTQEQNYLLSTFLPRDASTDGKETSELHEQPGILKVWYLKAGQPPKIVHERETTWNRSHLYPVGAEGSEAILDPSPTQMGLPESPWRLRFNQETGIMTVESTET